MSLPGVTDVAIVRSLPRDRLWLVGWLVVNQTPNQGGTKVLSGTITLIRGFVYGIQDELCRGLPENRARASTT